MASRATAHSLMAVFEHSLNMRVEVSFGDAMEFLRVLDSYNQMVGSKVEEMLEAIDKIIPRALYPDVGGRPNPNNGTRTYTIRVGRESSPVVYLHRYIHRGYDPLTKEQVAAIEFIAKGANTDEIGYRLERNGAAVCRFNSKEWTENTTIESFPLLSSLPEIGSEEFRFWWD